MGIYIYKCTAKVPCKITLKLGFLPQFDIGTEEWWGDQVWIKALSRIFLHTGMTGPTSLVSTELMLRQCPPNAFNEELQRNFWNLVKQIVLAEHWLRLLDNVRGRWRCSTRVSMWRASSPPNRQTAQSLCREQNLVGFLVTFIKHSRVGNRKIPKFISTRWDFMYLP